MPNPSMLSQILNRNSSKPSLACLLFLQQAENPLRLPIVIFHHTMQLEEQSKIVHRNLRQFLKVDNCLSKPFPMQISLALEVSNI